MLSAAGLLCVVVFLAALILAVARRGAAGPVAMAGWAAACVLLLAFSAVGGLSSRGELVPWGFVVPAAVAAVCATAGRSVRGGRSRRPADGARGGSDESGAEERLLCPLTLPAENIFGHTKKLEYILQHVATVTADNPRAVILDFGCGNGEAVSQYIIAALPPTARYIGVDIHAASREHATRRFGRPNAEFVAELPEGESCDVIVYADVLEHLDEPAGFLAEHYGHLKPGGLIVGSIPNGVGPFELESWVDRRLRISERIATLLRGLRRVRGAAEGERVPYNSESGHLQFYRKKPFVRMLESAGFRVTEFRNGTFFGAMVSERILRIGGARLYRANAAIADVLPYWMVSTWLFAARKPAEGESQRTEAGSSAAGGEAAVEG